ncbi:hypothetical protein BHM03_00023021 [Ensete ventricosum]|nr:hypothetical protein BHM03_00023021 [Ensete ventricosum]
MQSKPVSGEAVVFFHTIVAPSSPWLRQPKSSTQIFLGFHVERDGTFLATFAVTETTAAAPPAAPSLQSRAHVPAVGDGLTMHGEQVKLQRRGGGDPHAAGEKNQPTSMAFIASSTHVHF